jgi:hypothetical protein
MLFETLVAIAVIAFVVVGVATVTAWIVQT